MLYVNESEVNLKVYLKQRKKFKQLESDEEKARKNTKKRIGFLLRSSRTRNESNFTIEERAKFLHDTNCAQRKIPCSTKIRSYQKQTTNKESIKKSNDDLLKACGNFKHAELKIKKFEESTSFDEIDQGSNVKKKVKKEVKQEVRRNYKQEKWMDECIRTKPQTNHAEDFEEINQNVVIRSNGQKRYFSTLMRVLSIFDREDLNAVYKLVMDRFQDEMSEGFHRKLHSSSGVHTLVTETGLVIHMLVEKKYPLRKEVLVQMLKLKLESEEDSTMALELIKFVKKLLAELELED
ncbi:hypothetical protein Tco_0402101 [Tanacetum coccineum]